jgi:hypothetical protein
MTTHDRRPDEAVQPSAGPSNAEEYVNAAAPTAEHAAHDRSRREFTELCARMSLTVPPAVMLLASSDEALASIGARGNPGRGRGWGQGGNPGRGDGGHPGRGKGGRPFASHPGGGRKSR